MRINDMFLEVLVVRKLIWLRPGSGSQCMNYAGFPPSLGLHSDLHHNRALSPKYSLIES